MTAPKKVTVVSDAPMALASDGKLLVNVTHLKDGDILEAARELLDAGHTLFVGIAAFIAASPPLSDSSGARRNP